jgi:hypothetical protein
MQNEKGRRKINACMRVFDRIMPKAYQNEATAKQAIVGKNKQNFTLKINGTHTQTETCYDMISV